jgi:type IV secretory pathway TrbD component
VFRGRTLKLLVLVILLVAGLSDVSLAVATVGDALCAVYDSSNSFTSQSAVVDPTVELTGQIDSPLAAVGLELLKVPTVDAAANAIASVVKSTSNYKVMPAVPTAFLMVITGFLCISLVKDRKTWLAACVGLVCLWQLSLSALPKVAANFKDAFMTSVSTSLVSLNVSEHDSEFRVRSEVEGTRYIGLLRKLSGIPDTFGGSTFNTLSDTDSVCDFVISTQQNLTYKVSTLAAHITSLFNFDSLLACRLRSTGQISVFSPALIISNLPHGPPV